MKDYEKIFIHELEVFRREVEGGTQYFYAYLAINMVLGKDKEALDTVNETPLFWRTNAEALKTSFFVVLSRIFEYKSTHNINRLLEMAYDNIEIFSKDALAKRKRKESPNADEFLGEYLRSAYEPLPRDFNRLRKLVIKHRITYEDNYREIRNKIYAHKVVSKKNQISALFNKTNIRELEIIFTFLNKLYEALWQLVNNGRKPVLRPMPYSVKRIGGKTLPEWQSKTVQERIVNETKTFFSLLCHRERNEV